ncbi:MAG TPA: ATPase domain-containing protein [Thermoplasmata archaeon]|nr:ATPase domain-containing protein [Thermoplasmata archaeon]
MTDSTDASAERAPPRDEASPDKPKARKPVTEPSDPAPPSGDRIVERWKASVNKADRPKRPRSTAPTKGSSEVLRKWVGGDDSALESWIQSTEPTAAPAPSNLALAEALGVPPTAPEGPRPTAPGPPDRSASPAATAAIGEREATLVRWLTDLLDRVKSDQFEPHSLVQELQDIQRQLYDERQKRKQMEEELEHVKRGSIAVIKYVRNREAKSREQLVQEMEGRISELQMALDRAGTEIAPGPGAPAASTSGEGVAGPPSGPEGGREPDARIRLEFAEREHGYIERETELRRRQIQLEEEIRNLRSEIGLSKKRLETVGADERSLTEALQSRMNTADMRERELARRENELRAKFEEIRLQTEEIERRRTPLEYKEKELQSWEQELRIQKEAVTLQMRRVEEAKLSGASLDSLDKTKRLTDLQTEITKKEEELRSREEFLSRRVQELEGLERKAAEGEADKSQADIAADTSTKRVRTGVRRLDDLLFGGIPLGSQLLINGPAHTGKDVLARAFMTEGLRNGAGAIWVLTDKTYQTVREEATGFLPNYLELEQKGLVKYIDLYSRSLGLTEGERNAVLFSMTDKGSMESLATRVNEFATEFRQKGIPYRLVFESVSTITAYLDTAATFRFLQPFVGRRKVDGAAGYYLIETGMHSESDVRTLEHMMDGSINLKIDQLKNFLSVRGITDVQSRAWVGYTFTKRAFSLGSFSLDHIR